MQTQSERAEDLVVKLLKNGEEVQTLDKTALLNTLSLEDGRYELVAQSASNPAMRSHARGFTVVNHVPEMSITFRSADGTDLTRPVKGRLEFFVDTMTSSVPMQKVDLVVTKLDGTPVTKRTTDVVLPNMKLGFRFNSIPDGDYLIFYRGYLPAAGAMRTVESTKIQVKNQNI